MNPPAARWPGIIGLLLLATSTAAMLALHRARPDLNMLETPLSFYSHGAGAWLLTVSLLTSGAGVIVLAGSLVPRAQRKTGIAALVLAGAGMIIAAIFIADPWYPWERALTPRGWIHAAVVGLAVVCFPIGALLASADSGVSAGDRLARRMLWAVSLAFVATLTFFGGMTVVFLAFQRQPILLGLAERLLMTLAVAWLVVVAPVPRSLVGGGKAE